MLDVGARLRAPGLLTAVPTLAGGYYYSTNPNGGAVSTLQYARNRLVMLPCLFVQQTVIAELGIWVVTGGGAGATLRLVMYSDFNGKPLFRMITLGATAATSDNTAIYWNSSNANTFPYTVTPGVYWFGQLNQGSDTSVQTAGYANANTYPVACLARPSSSTGIGSQYQDGITGAPSSRASTGGNLASCPQIWYKTQ